MQWGDGFGWVLDGCMNGQGTRGHQPAIGDNYHHPRENASYHLVILQCHLWGEKSQMPAIGGRQITGGNGANPSSRKVSIRNGY
jgi:hypothetical protein